MKFGVFYIGNNPKEVNQDPRDISHLNSCFHQWIEQIVAADRVGFDYVFVGEHHFMGEFSAMSAPDVFMSALTQATRNIRIGSAVIQLAASHNHPVRVAERISSLDILSRGRFEFGSGPALSFEATPLAQRNPAEKARLLKEASVIWRENLEEIIKMLEQPGYPGCSRDFLDLPPLAIEPGPWQRPHPPLWRPSVTDDGILSVANGGMGCFMLCLNGPEQIRRNVEGYWDVLQNNLSPIGKSVNPATAVFVHALIAETDQEAEHRAREGMDFYSYARGRAPSLVGSMGNIAHEFKNGKLPNASFPLDLGSNAAFGSVETVRERLRQLEDTGVDMVVLAMQNGGTRHEHILESVDYFGRCILPEFKEREASHVKWREHRLQDVRFPINATV